VKIRNTNATRKIWITDGVENKTIKKYEIIPQNWYRGQTKKQKIN
jgi:hypothetical protein